MGDAAGDGEAEGASARSVLAASVLAGLALALYGLPWTFQGLDVTDEGALVTRSWIAAVHTEDYVFGPRWLAELALGAWLVLGEGLRHARLSWVLGVFAWGGVTCAALAQAFPVRWAAAGAVAAGVACLCRGPLLLEPNLCSAVLALGGTAALLAGPRGAAGGWRRLAAAAAGGGLLALGAAARLPHLAGGALPVVLLALRTGVERRRPTRPELRGAGAALLGWAVVLGVLAAALKAGGRWSELADFGSRFNVKHDPGHLMWLLGLTTVEGAITGLEVLGAVLLLHAGARALESRVAGERGRIALRAAAVVLGAGYVLLKSGWGRPATTTVVVTGVALVLGLALLGGGLLARGRPAPWPRGLEVLGLGLACGLLSPLGSNIGITRLCYAGGPLLAAGLLLLLELEARPVLRAAEPTPPPPGRRLGLALAVALVAGGVAGRWQPYRDDPNRLRLRAEVDHPRLAGIRTTPARAASLERLLDVLADLVEPGDRLLAYDSLPLLHYLTETRPAVAKPWPDTVGVAHLQEAVAAWGDAPPRVVVRARTNPESPRWGLATDLGRPWRHRDQQRLLDAAVAARPYRLAWSNDDFEVLVLEP